METRAFQPLYTPATGTGASGSLSASTTIAASTAAATTTAPFSGTANNQVVQIQVANQTSAWCFVNFGVFGAVTAATVAASYPVAPGAVVVVSVAAEVNSASVILAAGGTAGSVTFTRGEGL
jgi:hypothetical protein